MICSDQSNDFNTLNENTSNNNSENTFQNSQDTLIHKMLPESCNLPDDIFDLTVGTVCSDTEKYTKTVTNFKDLLLKIISIYNQYNQNIYMAQPNSIINVLNSRKALLHCLATICVNFYSLISALKTLFLQYNCDQELCYQFIKLINFLDGLFNKFSEYISFVLNSSIKRYISLENHIQLHDMFETENQIKHHLNNISLQHAEILSKCKSLFSLKYQQIFGDQENVTKAINDLKIDVENSLKCISTPVIDAKKPLKNTGKYIAEDEFLLYAHFIMSYLRYSDQQVQCKQNQAISKKLICLLENTILQYYQKLLAANNVLINVMAFIDTTKKKDNPSTSDKDYSLGIGSFQSQRNFMCYYGNHNEIIYNDLKNCYGKLIKSIEAVKQNVDIAFSEIEKITHFRVFYNKKKSLTEQNTIIIPFKGECLYMIRSYLLRLRSLNQEEFKALLIELQKNSMLMLILNKIIKDNVIKKIIDTYKKFRNSIKDLLENLKEQNIIYNELKQKLNELTRENKIKSSIMDDNLNKNACETNDFFDATFEKFR
ncbi:hypothetical protein EDEG_02767 [Edhazardia aedis USNM 41457]|uniref:Uncharacterized protein n=1 Tax=Edhazardia aedis (strain USNM 41457) TaxID=1003232 RepID=J9D4T4_EDHAE|nr:hypothetical protein EDEG_02767 [Edhazardia aedis USNM 41457]|eukprot:EJW02826.1 hypothetical protein EDEG_02767 [Edhazardia aedis USNM 41457]